MRSIFLLVCVLSAYRAYVFDDELYRDVLDPVLCKRQLKMMRQFEFYDASFHAPQGLLAGNFASLGNYHQCLAINQAFPNTNIQGKYCLIQAPLSPPTVRIPSLAGISASENMTWTEVTLSGGQMQKYAGKSLSLAVCVPKSCSVAAVLGRYTEHPVVRFNYTEQYCRLPNDKPFVAADYFGTVIFSLLCLLTLVSTAYELRHVFILRKDPEQASELFRICSLYTNTQRLLASGKPGALDCLDGIRTLSTLWVIIVHTSNNHYIRSKYVANGFDLAKWRSSSGSSWFMAGHLAVDSFFTIGGLLLVYTSVKKFEQTSLLRNLPMFYLNRYLRLFPLLATAVLLEVSVIHRVMDGPDWHTVADEVHLCRCYWWSALLHVQNIFNGEEKCMSTTWYLSVDMQLHVLSPLVLYWLLGSRRAACTALGVAILATVAGTLAFCYIALFTKFTSIKQIYFSNTLARSPPFFIGMLFGYILHIFKGQNIQLPQRIVFVCHILALSIYISAIYLKFPYAPLDLSLRRPCWSLALCWLIFACIHGYGGPVNWLLSLRLWKFPSRISYAMYLFHSQIQLSNVAANVAPIYFNMEMMFSYFVSDLMNTVMLSTVACVLIEEPALTLQRILLRVGTSKTPQEPKNVGKSVSDT